MAQEGVRVGRGLKLLVTVMTVLLALGMALLVYGMLRAGSKAKGAFGEAAVALPDGARTAGWQASGERLLVDLAGPGEDEQSILVIDLATGRELGVIRLGLPP